ncbi:MULTISPECIES: cobalamin biosynthesis protein CobG [unclassified Streptomyces]|uniref:cobalamin biosynthesis protein CobG n=1 Tax=unclassified Streptomyces TaxID=2593676 RepID=UPI00224EC1E1|nr:MULTISPECIES: cobalamin biosynthesis protein CobG [unclassified Streptomyces]MCX4528773.1 cobalamin biosynthesis protein CobG [Streptomyces sp. NBC_01551]MCX4540619.1 cobalamin biosynthesis protein CobG [Streptomyces sp. NBC_01565]
MPQPPSAASRDEPVIRDGGDACPGALRLHAADDGFLARVRIPGGLLGPAQAAALADAADRYGDGHLELTSRGNVQLRGLADGCGAGLAELLDAAGLLPAPSHERVRNIVASPLGDPAPVRALDRLLCADPEATALSGRFLFAVDDGRGDVAALDPDVTLLGQPGGRALVRLGAAADAVEVAAADGPGAALEAARHFLAAAAAAGTRAWRVAELPAEHALDTGEFIARLTGRGIAARYVPDAPRPYADPPAPGPHGDALCVLIPLGRLATAQWRELPGELRVTPWRSVVVADLGAAAGLGRAGLVTSPGSAWEAVTACTGRPGCAKALADVRADARAVVERARGPLPVHWSGCERRCGHPRGTDWVDAVATATGYRLTAPGRPVPRHVSAPDLGAALLDARNTPRISEDAVKK